MAETTRWLNEDEDRAWRGLMAMQEALSGFIEHQLRRRCGLSLADYQVLAHLSEAPGGRLRSFEMGQLLHWEKSRLSQHLGRMQGRGLLLRERCLTDKRGAVVIITAEGSAVIEAAAPQHLADVRAAFLDQLSSGELETLTALSIKVRSQVMELAEDGQEPAPSPRQDQARP